MPTPTVYRGRERRKFLRYGYEKPLHFSIVDSSEITNSVSTFLKAISKNLSVTGILFSTRDVLKISSMLILDLDYKTTSICHEIENHALIINNKLLGKVVRIEDKDDGSFDIGVAFATKADNLPGNIQELVK